MEEAYRIITLFVLPGMLLALGLCFFFLSIPPNAGLKNYRTARLVMGYAYVVYAVSLFTAHYGFFNFTNNPFSQSISLFISSVQAFLFTFTLITLIDTRFLTHRRIFREAVLILSGSATTITLSSFLPHDEAQLAVYFFCGLYMLLIIRYVRMFRKHYRGYTAKMDNYFSNEETHRLQWVSLSFYGATFIGAIALVFALFHTLEVALPFIVLVLIFYSCFGIRFINYAFVFQTFETAIEEEVYVIPLNEKNETEEEESELMRRIDDLMRCEELYKNADISIDDIALALSEKHYAISGTINRYREMNFKAYINEYRVQEAAKLLLEDKECRLTVDAVASAVGFSDRSNFYRVFKKHKGLSPSDFRKNC